MFPDPNTLVLEIDCSYADGGTEGKAVKFSWPNDAQWAERARKRKIVQKAIGRGKSIVEDQPGHKDIDLALVNDLLRQDSPSVTAEEASRLLNEIALADVLDAVAAGREVEVTLNTIAGETVHCLRKPSMKEQSDYSAAAVKVFGLPYGREELTLNLDAAATLYDALLLRREGYVGAVPIVHKQAVVGAVLQASKPEIRMVVNPN